MFRVKTSSSNLASMPDRDKEILDKLEMLRQKRMAEIGAVDGLKNPEALRAFLDAPERNEQIIQHQQIVDATYSKQMNRDTKTGLEYAVINGDIHNAKRILLHASRNIFLAPKDNILTIVDYAMQASNTAEGNLITVKQKFDNFKKLYSDGKAAYKEAVANIKDCDIEKERKTICLEKYKQDLLKYWKNGLSYFTSVIPMLERRVRVQQDILQALYEKSQELNDLEAKTKTNQIDGTNRNNRTQLVNLPIEVPVG